MAGRMGSIDVTHEFAKDVRAAMATERDDALLVAEHGHDASGDLLGDGWHGTMNYAGFTRQVWCWLRSPEFRETFLGLPVEVPVITGEQAVASIRAFHARIPWRSLVTSWNILGSHDTARIRTVVGTPERQVAALALAIGLPGVPMVFAGDEIGATGAWGEDARTPFPWNDRAAWDTGMLDAYRSCWASGATACHWPSGACGGCMSAPTRWLSSASTPTSRRWSSWPATSPSPSGSRWAFSMHARFTPCSASTRASSPIRLSSKSRQRVLACGEWRVCSHG